MVWRSLATANREEVKTVRSEAQRLVYLAVMTALSVVLTRVAAFRWPLAGLKVSGSVWDHCL